MKRLILMRHAHAQTEAASDFERKLSAKGLEQASMAGTFLSDLEIDEIWVSPALRTMQTLRKIAEKFAVRYVIKEEIYNASEEELEELILLAQDSFQSIMLIGHNPGIYKLAINLVNAESSGFTDLIEKITSPATVTVIDFPELNNWKDLKRNSGICKKRFEP